MTTLKWLFRQIGSGWEWCFGLLSLIAALAVLASIPIVQLLSLGYLLEVSGRVARSGRLRDGLVGVRKAARVGSLVVGSWLILLPLRVLSNQWHSAELVASGSPAARTLRIALIGLTAVAAVHLLWAWLRGGRLRHFLWPAPLRLIRTFRRGRWWAEARDGAWEFVAALHLPHYFWLGTRGFIGAVLWLLVPTLLLVASTRLPQAGAAGGGGAGSGAAALLGLLGGVLLAVVMLYLPFLQTRFAAENRLAAFWRIGTVRQDFRRAPLAFWFALLVTLASALPLYLLKIEATPQEVVGVLSLVFVVFIFPARLLTGWAMGRAMRRDRPRYGLFRWTARLAAVPLVAFYVFVLFFTQYTSWYGAWSMLEQHAVLVPVPFFEWPVPFTSW
ncbi:DUF4013 domain-containing protein [Candidatus Laterigemmans baculatus]|uniref:DUF4013 domain-containing protein n=1 Tax=Candidatus Laterigemmans baculatus TaxID=2770505 RepID=UPI0013D97EDD|nr:DUF4013 domain-containing protein [Candidatus Laterigemmans baculatus]